MNPDPDLYIWEDGPVAAPFRLRDYQIKAKEAVATGWATYSRQLLDMATGTGKTTLFAAIAAEWYADGSKTLVIENRDALVRQTAKRIANETGLETDIEMASDHASPFAPIVVASVATLMRDNRLTGFAPDHFRLLVCDEAHHNLSKSFMKVCSYFHYGAESLQPDWVKPEDGTYQPKAAILGTTATPELAGKRQLGEFYQKVAFTYQLFQAVQDGWLVPAKATMEPLQCDFKGLRAKRTTHGLDYDPTEIAARMIPIIEALAKQIVRLAGNRKTMAFMPSVNTANLLAEAINRNGLRAIFVSGECLDRDEKTEEFVVHGPGIVLSTAALYTEGFDVPDVDCVFPGITKSRGYYRQKVGRATRPLPGIFEGLETAQERRAAIAASAKPDFLVIDPFCRSEIIDLCDVYDLYTDTDEVKQAMKAAGPPSPESAEKAERDFIKTLEKEARKHARKVARTIDPLRWAVSISDEQIANYVHETPADAGPVTPGQLGMLERAKINTSKITCSGLADKIIRKYMNRVEHGLATPEQLEFLHTLGFPDEKAAFLTKDAAGAIIGRLKAQKGWN